MLSHVEEEGAVLDGTVENENLKKCQVLKMLLSNFLYVVPCNEETSFQPPSMGCISVAVIINVLHIILIIYVVVRVKHLFPYQLGL